MSDSASGTVTVPTLIVTGGPLDGTSFQVDDSSRERLLGSSTDCDLQLLLGNVEPVHAKVTRGARGLLLSDGGSATGTYVNGEKIETDYLLQDGDRVCLGPPGSKNSAKLLVKVPAGGAALPLEAGRAEDPVLAVPDKLVLVEPGSGLAPVQRDAPGAPTVSFPSPPSAPFAPPPFPPPPPPPFPPPPYAAAPDPPAPTFPIPPPPPPPPPAATPVPAARPAPPPPPPPASRARPEYTDAPSIAAEPSRPHPVPAHAPAAPRPARKSPLRTSRRGFSFSVPPGAIYGLLAALLLGAGWAGYTYLMTKPPTLKAVVPPRTEPGQTVTLDGEGFSSSAGGNIVRFGSHIAQVSSATDSRIAVTVPAVFAAGGPEDVPVTVETRAGRSAAATLKVYRAPKVTGVEPDVVMPGQEIVVTGQNLGGKPLTVSVGGMAAAVSEAEPGQLRLTVPKVPLVEGAKVTVNVQIGPDSAKPAEVVLGRLPLILSVTPPRGSAGDTVVIKGRGFDPDPAGNQVTFSGQPALLLAASASELTVAAPTTATAESQAQTEVTVRALGSTSTSPASFVLTRLSSSSFVPRFFAAPVVEAPGEDLAFVSTDLGPVLVLGGKADAPSTGERASRVARALNQLVERGTDPGFELRERPQPGVGTAGAASPLLTATAADAAAYGRSWEAGARAPRRPSPRALAAHWTALLQDYCGLFLLRQRPVRLLALNPRGRVLSDLYADAVRQGGGSTGVPTRLVLPPSPSLQRNLRGMALVVADQPAQAAATIEGRWTGTMEESAGARKFEVRLRVDSGRLAGALTTKSGAVEMRAPLRDLAYDKGVLRFVVDLSGQPRLFSGPVQIDTVEGAIRRTTGDKAEVGRFTLKYAE